MLGNKTTVGTRILFKQYLGAELKNILVVHAGNFIFPVIYFIRTVND
jgi:hypothetical protein